MKIMAIDYGDAHTGIAVSDALLTLAGFTTVITAYRPEAVAAEIQRLIAEHGVTELVLGHPLNMDGTRARGRKRRRASRRCCARRPVSPSRFGMSGARLWTRTISSWPAERTRSSVKRRWTP